MVKLRRVVSGNDIIEARKLFQEYADSLDFALCFQDFDHELHNLPGDYAPPDGTIILAEFGSEIAGCVALRRLDNEACEMKRLFVRPEYRGSGIGRKLAEAVIEDAREIGYKYMRLDTIPSMIEATLLYSTLGFTKIEPYRHNPIEGALYLELKL